MRKFGIMLCLAVLGMGCHTTSKNKVAVVKIHTMESSISLSKGSSFKVELPLPEGTPADWELEKPVKSCSFTSSMIIKKGSSAIRQMEFTANETGREKVWFVCKPTSASNKTVIEKRLLTVNVY